MRVRVEAVDGDRVRFSCAAGAAEARWVGPAPAVGEHEVEVEVSGTVAAIGEGETLEPGRLVARVEAIDDDGVVALRLRGGRVVLDEAGPATVVGRFVEVGDARFELFPARRRDDGGSAGPAAAGRAAEPVPAVAARVVVRSAQLDDAAAIAAIWFDAWQTQFRGLVPAPVLASLSLDARVEHWRWRLADGDSTLVAELDGNVVGYCRFDGGEILSLYAGRRGRGIGSLLMAAALEQLDGPVHLWVFAGNTRARAFYERHGFRPDSPEQIDPGTGIAEIRMARP